MNYTLEELQKMMNENGGWLYLSGTQITSLPDNLTVGGSLNLSNTAITSLPDNLTVGGGLDLSNTAITSLPDNLTVGGWLDLSNTAITSLPDNLTVGGGLDLSNTAITSLPDNLTVGGSLNLRNGKEIYRNDLKNGFYQENKFIYCDDILTHITAKKTWGKYTYFKGKIKGKNVIFDGENYANCKDFKSGVADLEFKAMKDRGAEQFNDLTLSSVITREKAIAMYRIITGSCQAGTQAFVDEQKELKESYTVSEIIELTKGRYGSEVFKKFFEKEKNL